MHKRLATIALAGAVGLGGLGVAAVSPLGIAGAQDGSEQTSGVDDARRGGPLARALDALVADGTLTQEQADAVVATTQDEVAEARAERKEHRQERRTAVLDAAAGAIGSTPDDVRSGLRSGTSIATQAEAEGVERSTVEAAIGEVLRARLDAAVADGRLSEERAAKAAERLDEVVDRIVDADGQGRERPRGDGTGRDRLRDRLQERFGN
jgi:polyhydroxyalkanoate synthesis regulator phasin